MEVHKWEKWGPLLRFSFLHEEGNTELLCLKDPRTYYGRQAQPGDKITYRLIVIEGIHEGLIFKGHEVFHERGIIKISLVRKAKIVSTEDVIELSVDNQLDKVLIEMGAMDDIGNELLDE